MGIEKTDATLKTVMRISILKPPPLRIFLIVSVILHFFLLLVHGVVPVPEEKAEAKPPIKVRYVPPEPQKVPKQFPTLVDTPKPKKLERPDRSDLVSKFDSKAHSKRKISPTKKYQNKKTAVPKSSGSAAITKKTQAPSKKKKTPQKPLDRNKFPLKQKGFILPLPEKPLDSPDQNAPTGSALALLDGFNADKFASLNTRDFEIRDDNEVISLDTKEVKYASYFLRIKHQIERVWVYPQAAARRGISGQLTLRFKISKNGNLLDVRLTDVSGSDILDFAAVQAVKGAAPYYPFPVTIDKENLSILATFVYSPTYTQYQKNR